MSYENGEKPSRWYTGWHLDKRFHIGNLATIIVLAISVAIYIKETEFTAKTALKQIEVEKEARITADQRLAERLDRRNERLNERLTQIQKTLERMEKRMYEKKNN